MLTHDQLATVRAALLFWQEEICPHSPEVSLSYLNVATTEILSADAVAKLRSRFTNTSVRYALADLQQGRLVTTELIGNWGDAVHRANGSMVVASLILP